MTGFIHAEEVEVTNRLVLAIRHTVDGVVGQLSGLESGAIRVVDGVHHELTAVPVANPVCEHHVSVFLEPGLVATLVGLRKGLTQVSGPDQNVDSGLNNFGQGVKE